MEARPDGAHGGALHVEAAHLPRVRIRNVSHVRAEEAPPDTQRSDPKVQTARLVNQDGNHQMNMQLVTISH